MAWTSRYRSCAAWLRTDTKPSGAPDTDGVDVLFDMLARGLPGDGNQTGPLTAGAGTSHLAPSNASGLDKMR